MSDFLFTSESVCSGHPDKVCDQISDAILDEVLKQDKNGRVAVETMATFGRVIITGEITAHAKVDYKTVAREQIKRLGYTIEKLNFTNKSPIEVYIHEQSPEIAQGVDEEGAGDQGMMFGFACRDTKEFMPLPITLAHALAKRIDETREKKILPYLRPDGKTQVTIEYKNNKPYKVKSIVIAVPHNEKTTLEEVKQDMFDQVVKSVMKQYGFSVAKHNLIVNGTGVWHHSGPAVDTGLTGRKIVVDGYGGFARVGGGAFSGKDPTKVDRSGAYAARYIAKNIVAQGLAEKAEVQLSYVIGGKKPLMQQIEAFDTEVVPQRTLNEFANQLIDTSVRGIINHLNLLQPIYLETAAYGHFGKEQLPWEKIAQ